MRSMKTLLSVCLATLFLVLALIPSLAAEPKLCIEEFYWDKAGEDAENGYKAYDIPYGSALKIPDDPVREGCRFLGWKDWYTDEFVDLSTQIMDASGRRFYAAWQKNVFTITYYVDGAVYQVDTYSQGAQVILPEPPKKEGYVFDGWTWGMGLLCVVIDPPETMPAADLHATARFTKGTCTFTFYDGERVHAVIIGTPGEAFVVPRSPEREGYSFRGWDPELPKTTPDLDGTFYTVFEANTYIATLIVDDEIYKEIPYTYGQMSVTLPEVPKKEGYTGMWGPYSLGIGGTKIEAIYSPLDTTIRTVDGDADGNGEVDLKDVVLLTRALAGGWNACVCTANMDVNADGIVNLKDVVLIRRYLAGGWNVCL